MIKVVHFFVFLGAVLISANSAHSSPEDRFWSWFQQNEAILFDVEKNLEPVFDQLQSELQRVHPSLVFEFGPKQDDGTREFTISADGIREAFPFVEQLHASAPKMDRWVFVKFRQRREPMDLYVGDRKYSPEDIHFTLFRDGSKIGILLFFEDYHEPDRLKFAQIAYLFLDNGLGEYIVETEIGFVDFSDRDSEFFEGSPDLTELWDAFQWAMQR